MTLTTNSLVATVGGAIIFVLEFTTGLDAVDLILLAFGVFASFNKDLYAICSAVTGLLLTVLAFIFTGFFVMTVTFV